MGKNRYRGFTDALRDAIRRSGLNPNQLHNATQVLSDSISRFMRGEQSLRLEAADRLAAFLRVRAVLPGKTERSPTVLTAKDYINVIIDDYNSTHPKAKIPHTGGHFVTLHKFCDGEKIQALFKRKGGTPEIQVGVVLDSPSAARNRAAAEAYLQRLGPDIAGKPIEDVPTKSGSNVGLLLRFKVADAASLAELSRQVVAAVPHILSRLGRL
jgi:hypothetical protein